MMSNVMLRAGSSFTPACMLRSNSISKSSTTAGSGNRRRAHRKTNASLANLRASLKMSQISRFFTVWEESGRMVWKKDEHAYTWSDLDGHLAECVLCAPRTGSDPTGAWPKVHARVIGYLMRNVRGKP